LAFKEYQKKASKPRRFWGEVLTQEL